MTLHDQCRQLHIPYREQLSKVSAVIPYAFAKEHRLLAVEEEAAVLTVASASPFCYDALQQVKLFSNKKVRLVCCPKEVLDEAIERCYQSKEVPLEASTQKTASIEGIEGYDLLEERSDNAIIGFLNTLLLEAIRHQASDIHFEPFEERIEVRLRLDGVLQKRRVCPKELQAQLLTRLKVMAKLDIAEQRLPQDGRMKLKVSDREIDFRVSTIPVAHGERVVLRILDKSNVILGLDYIGMDEKVLKPLRRMISLPEGILLVTGPTGSGKTTTLYSALSEIATESTNVMTIEDPVEYKLPSIAQISVNPKIDLTFAKGLRHILRQDPDVIMIGEIRDRETAEIAIQASLTGHLVLSTLHTNDAPSALTRLADMGIEPYLLSSSICGVVSQRLVRKICSHCKASYGPTRDELQELEIKGERLAKLYRGEGCEHCFKSGYKGRLAIFELMPMTSKLKRQIIMSADAVQLRAAALPELKLLFDYGIDLVRKGQTTLSELLRVTALSEEIQGE